MTTKFQLGVRCADLLCSALAKKPPVNAGRIWVRDLSANIADAIDWAERPAAQLQP